MNSTEEEEVVHTVSRPWIVSGTAVNWKSKFTSEDETATRREAPFLAPQISPQWRDEEEARGGCNTGNDVCTYEDEFLPSLRHPVSSHCIQLTNIEIVS